MKKFSHIPLELIFWVAALVLLALAAPLHGHPDNHVTLCPLANMGFEWCPGCGIGRAIGLLLHGEIAESIKYHWFGMPALGIICYRIVVLIKLKVKSKREFKLI